MNASASHPDNPVASPAETPARIVLFDGDCAFCNASCVRLLHWDKRRMLRFASQQGEYARRLCERGLIAPEQLHDRSSILFLETREGKTRVSLRSTAGIRIAAGMGGLWKLSLLFLVVPAFLRDGIYDFIARRRYRWFGKQTGDICRLLTPDEQRAILDT